MVYWSAVADSVNPPCLKPSWIDNFDLNQLQGHEADPGVTCS